MTRRPQGAGGLRERNGRWQSSTRDPRTGKTLWRTWPHGTTRRQAEKLHTEWLAEVGQRRPADRTLTVAGYLTTWLAVRAADMSDATHARHTANTKVLERHVGALKLNELEPLTLQHAFAELAGRYAPRTVRSIRATASLAFGDAVRWERLPANPMTAVRLPRAPVDEDRATPTTEQVHALCAGETDPLWRTLWEVLAGTGARPGEVLALRWRDVNVAERTLTIARTITYTKDGARPGDRTKTGRARTIVIDDHLAGVFAAWRSQLAELDLAAVRGESPLFPSPTTRSGVVTQRRLAQRFREGMARVGADEAITPHAVRHWYVSTWMAQGLPAQTIAEHCGHSLAEVLRRYGKHAPASALAEVAAKMPKRTVDNTSA